MELNPDGFKVFAVTDHSVNPTADQDYENNQLLQEQQYPLDCPPARYLYSDVDDPESTDYEQPGPLDTDYVLLRCGRYPKNEYLRDAQKFFNRKRLEYRWTHECPIYRTQRFWCKRTFGGTYPSTMNQTLIVPIRVRKVPFGV